MPPQACAQKGVLRAKIGKPPGIRGKNGELLSLRELGTVREDELPVLR
jgi:hypothetical protein